MPRFLISPKLKNRTFQGPIGQTLGMAGLPAMVPRMDELLDKGTRGDEKVIT